MKCLMASDLFTSLFFKIGQKCGEKFAVLPVHLSVCKKKKGGQTERNESFAAVMF